MTWDYTPLHINAVFPGLRVKVIIVIIIVIIIIIIIIIEYSHIDFYQRICFIFEVWRQRDSSHVNNFLEESAGMYQDSSL